MKLLYVLTALMFLVVGGQSAAAADAPGEPNSSESYYVRQLTLLWASVLKQYPGIAAADEEVDKAGKLDAILREAFSGDSGSPAACAADSAEERIAENRVRGVAKDLRARFRRYLISLCGRTITSGPVTRSHWLPACDTGFGWDPRVMRQLERDYAQQKQAAEQLPSRRRELAELVGEDAVLQLDQRFPSALRH